MRRRISAHIIPLFILTILATTAAGCTRTVPATKAPPASPVEAAPASAKASSADRGEDALRFAIDEGQLSNRFVRTDEVAAHVLLRSGNEPRVLASFPAANSGGAVWFRKAKQPVSFAYEGQVSPVSRKDGMRGVSFVVTAKAERLEVEQAVASNVRVLRNYMHTRKLPAAYAHEQEVSEEGVVWTRSAVDGASAYLLSMHADEGNARFVARDDGLVVEAAKPDQPIRLRFEILNTEKPLTPIRKTELVTAAVANDEEALNALAFLTYDEKLLAGSWRFLTYFGRDTLLSVRLLMPVLQPRVIEAGLGSILERLSDDGAVAHEEDIGEFAAMRHEAEGRQASRTPLHDYRMIDDDMLLAPVAVHYLLEHPEGRKRAEEFLNRKTRTGRTYRQALRANLDYVLGKAQPYARDPKVANLLAIPKDRPHGQWRDSDEGLGHAQIPYDVNVALVPAALEAAHRLFSSDLMKDEDAAKAAGEMIEPWRNTYAHFEVTLPASKARQEVEAYAKTVGIDPAPLENVMPDEDLMFPSLVLKEDGTKLPIMHTDDGFALLFTNPPPERLERTAWRINQPFPVGLKTEVGVVVANPAYADGSLEKIFTRNHYHGTVVWSWQQAMLAEGLARQLRRDDLPDSTRAALQSAQTTLWQLIENTREVATEELWSWKHANGKWTVAPFGQSGGDVTESNAVQLWSTVYLAVQPPKPPKPASTEN